MSGHKVKIDLYSAVDLLSDDDLVNLARWIGTIQFKRENQRAHNKAIERYNKERKT